MQKHKITLLFCVGLQLTLIVGCYDIIMEVFGYYGQYPITDSFIQDDRIIGLWEGTDGGYSMKYEIIKKKDYYELIDKEAGDDKDEHIGYIYISKIGSINFLNIYTNLMKRYYAPYNYAKYTFDSQGKCIVNILEEDYVDGDNNRLGKKTFASSNSFQNYISKNYMKDNFFGRKEVFTKNTNPRQGKDRAIFFTASDYKDSYWQPLPAVDKEVNLLANDLSRLYDFDVKVVQNATRDDIIKTLELYDNKQMYDTDSQLLLFFSMHGKSIQNRGYLIPSDGGAKVSSWVAHSHLIDIIDKLPCPRILVSIDACYSGTFGPNRESPGGADWEIDNLDCKVKCEIAFNNKYPTRKYITAGHAEDRVPANSQFAARWLKALKSGCEGDGILSYAELWGKLDQIGIIRPTNGTFSPGDKGDFVFVCKSGCTTW